MEEKIIESVRSTGGSISNFVKNIIGTYTPLVDQSTGEYITTSAGIDWQYIVNAAVFLIVLYFILKFITLIFKNV